MLFSITASKCCFQLFHETRRDRVPSPAPRLRLACHTHTHTHALGFLPCFLFFSSSSFLLLRLLANSFQSHRSHTHVWALFRTRFRDEVRHLFRNTGGHLHSGHPANTFGDFWALLATLVDVCLSMGFSLFWSYLLDMFKGKQGGSWIWALSADTFGHFLGRWFVHVCLWSSYGIGA